MLASHHSSSPAQVATGAWRRRAFTRGIDLALCKVAFPVPRQQPVLDRRHAHTSPDHLGIARSDPPAKSRSAHRLVLVQPNDQLFAQRADRLGIDRVMGLPRQT